MATFERNAFEVIAFDPSSFDLEIIVANAGDGSSGGGRGGHGRFVSASDSTYYPKHKDDIEDELRKAQKELLRKEREALEKQKSLDAHFKETVRLQLIALWNDIANKEAEIQALRERLRQQVNPAEEEEIEDIYLISRMLN